MTYTFLGALNAGAVTTVAGIASKIIELTNQYEINRLAHEAATSASERAYYFSEMTRIDNEIIKCQIAKRNLEKGEMDAMTKTLITGGALVAGLLALASMR